MALGGEHQPVAAADGRAEVLGLAGLLRDDDLVGHAGALVRSLFTDAACHLWRRSVKLLLRQSAVCRQSVIGRPNEKPDVQPGPELAGNEPAAVATDVVRSRYSFSADQIVLFA